MSKQAETQAVTPHEVDLTADRLLSAIDAGCDPGAGFPQQLEAALEATFALFAAEPDLFQKLVDRFAPEPFRVHQRRCAGACAARLRAAAKHAAWQTEGPPLVERFLIAAVQFELSRALHKDELSGLPERVPDLRDFILAYYSEAGSD